jgi:D-beta-D-heptose 7-phosphate kinase/D-beta-D-heptose 1-phosphate adenosyltransferase
MANIPDFGKAKVLVIGDVMLDRFWHGSATRMSPEAPVPVVNVGEVDDRPWWCGERSGESGCFRGKYHALGPRG